MYGVIFISVIFFALLLKQFKLLGPLIELLMIPEKFVWNYLVHGKASIKSGAKSGAKSV